MSLIFCKVIPNIFLKMIPPKWFFGCLCFCPTLQVPAAWGPESPYSEHLLSLIMGKLRKHRSQTCASFYTGTDPTCSHIPHIPDPKWVLPLCSVRGNLDFSFGAKEADFYWTMGLWNQLVVYKSWELVCSRDTLTGYYYI